MNQLKKILLENTVEIFYSHYYKVSIDIKLQFVYRPTIDIYPYKSSSPFSGKEHAILEINYSPVKGRKIASFYSDEKLNDFFIWLKTEKKITIGKILKHLNYKNKSLKIIS